MTNYFSPLRARGASRTKIRFVRPKAPSSNTFQAAAPAAPPTRPTASRAPPSSPAPPSFNEPRRGRRAATERPLRAAEHPLAETRRVGTSELSGLIPPPAPRVSLMFANENSHLPRPSAAPSAAGDQPWSWAPIAGQRRRWDATNWRLARRPRRSRAPCPSAWSPFSALSGLLWAPSCCWRDCRGLGHSSEGFLRGSEQMICPSPRRHLLRVRGDLAEGEGLGPRGGAPAGSAQTGSSV